jgi:hypothetical protein
MIRNGLIFSGLTIFISAAFAMLWHSIDGPRGNHFANFIDQSALFIAILYVVTFFTLLVVHQKTTDKVGFLFLAFVLIKMIIAGTFVILKLRDYENGVQGMIYFFPTYLILLLIEVIWITRLIRQDQH